MIREHKLRKRAVFSFDTAIFRHLGPMYDSMTRVVAYSGTRGIIRKKNESEQRKSKKYLSL